MPPESTPDVESEFAKVFIALTSRKLALPGLAIRRIQIPRA